MSQRRRRLPQEGASSRDIAILANQLLLGRVNTFGTVTLTANQATTTHAVPYINSNSVMLLMPTTANAAAALATTYIACSSGQAVLTHTNNAQSDRTFNFVVLGG